ncbi:unnamed protein product [Diplocarpon coronariae]|nr:hypothetical protein JHW43_007542 [Diplocarpon mali]
MPGLRRACQDLAASSHYHTAVRRGTSPPPAQVFALLLVSRDGAGRLDGGTSLRPGAGGLVAWAGREAPGASAPPALGGPLVSCAAGSSASTLTPPPIAWVGGDEEGSSGRTRAHPGSQSTCWARRGTSSASSCARLAAVAFGWRLAPPVGPGYDAEGVVSDGKSRYGGALRARISSLSGYRHLPRHGSRQRHRPVCSLAGGGHARMGAEMPSAARTHEAGVSVPGGALARARDRLATPVGLTPPRPATAVSGPPRPEGRTAYPSKAPLIESPARPPRIGLGCGAARKARAGAAPIRTGARPLLAPRACSATQGLRLGPYSTWASRSICCAVPIRVARGPHVSPPGRDRSLHPPPLRAVGSCGQLPDTDREGQDCEEIFAAPVVQGRANTTRE